MPPVAGTTGKSILEVVLPAVTSTGAPRATVIPGSQKSEQLKPP
jgi:hypothetical protein